MSRRGLTFAVVSGVLLCASAAHAAVLPPGGVTAADVAAPLKAKGMAAEIGVDQEGAPMITSETDATPFRVLFYGCNPQKRCATVMFSAGFDEDDGVPIAKVNAWNREKRFIRAFVDDDQDPFAVMDVDLERGATSEAVDNAVDTWIGILPLFKQHFR